MTGKDTLNFELKLEYCINNAPSDDLRNKMLAIQSSYNNHNKAMITGIAQQVFRAYDGIQIYLVSNNIQEA